jgi:hypothetical protein
MKMEAQYSSETNTNPGDYVMAERRRIHPEERPK